MTFLNVIQFFRTYELNSLTLDKNIFLLKFKSWDTKAIMGFYFWGFLGLFLYSLSLTVLSKSLDYSCLLGRLKMDELK